VVEEQGYQVEKIENLKIYFNNQLVVFQGNLIIPQEDGQLNLDFSTNTTLDYYQQQLSSDLKSIPAKVAEKELSLTKIFFHSILLVYFFIYLYWIIPIAGLRAQQKKIEKGREGGESHVRHDRKTSKGDKIAEYLLRLKTEPFPPHVRKEIEKKIRSIESGNGFFRQKENEEEQLDKIMELP
jgi:hypothetical protein